MKGFRIMCPHCKQPVDTHWQRVLFRLGFASMTGIMIGLLLVLLVGPNTIISAYSNTVLTRQAMMSADDLRELALNLTTFDGHDSTLFAKDLFTNLPRIRYVPDSKYGNIQNAKETLLYGGDCERMSTVFVALMMSAGYDAKVDCNVLEEHHCVAVIPEQGRKRGVYVMIDLTGDLFRLYENGVDHWQNNTNYEYSLRINKKNGWKTEINNNGYTI